MITFSAIYTLLLSDNPYFEEAFGNPVGYPTFLPSHPLTFWIDENYGWRTSSGLAHENPAKV
jgi:hypothetical protein